MNKKKTLIICIVILVVGAVITALIFFTEPSAQKEGATKQTAMLVDVVKAERGSYQPEITATGNVVPAKEVILSPRVSGEVISISSSFEPGENIDKGEVLLQIDPADYRNALQLRKSDLQQAKSDLDIEEGRQDVARRGYELVEDPLPDMNENLVLREPQLNSAKARVEAAQAAVNQAELDLQRTTIRAPFDAHVLSRNVNVGSQVALGDNIAQLVGKDVYWVMVNVPLSKLRWIKFPEDDEEYGSEVMIRNLKAWEEGVHRQGYVYQLIGSLEGQTRMARIIVAVPDPLALQNPGLPPLMINSFVEVRIKAQEIPDIIRLDREYLRQGETVWVMKNNKLEIRNVKVLLTDTEHAYIASGVEENEQVVTTNLSTVVEGADLRLIEADSVGRAEETGPGTN